jgi:predicted SAM-dependent methyltransferase
MKQTGVAIEKDTGTLTHSGLLKSLLSRALPGTLYTAWISARQYHRKKRKETSILQNNQRVLEQILSGKQPIKLELGAQKKREMEGWTTIDLNGKCDLCLDLSRPIPLPDSSVAVIYSSHVLEHLSYPKPLKALLDECYRILVPNGLFSAAVPDARIYLNAYAQPDNFPYKDYCVYDTGLSFRSKIDYVNYIAYMGGHHRFMFDEENLLIILAEASFREVRLRDFDPALDLAARRYETIYAEGKK